MFRRVRSRSALTWLLACGLFALSAERASASSIPLVDPSFELVNDAAWNAAVAGSTSASGFPIGSPPDGTRFMNLVGYPGGGMPAISQDAGVAVPGATYDLSFYSASRSDSSPNNIGIYGPLSALQFTASIVLRNGGVDTEIASTYVNPDLYTPGSWVQTTLSGAVPANATGNIVLKFVGTGLRGNDNQQTGIDKVVLDGSSALPTFTITSSSGANGAISPSGVVSVNQDGSQTFNITPAAGYRVAGVLVDGVSVGAVRSYTFNNVTGNHTISVSFVPNPVNDVVVGAAPYFYWYYYNNWGTWVHNGGLNFLRNGSATNYSQRGYFYYQNGSYNFRRGETRPAIGDLDGDGSAEIVLGTGPGAYGNLEVFTANGAHKSWATIPWPGYNGYNGETRPAVGDLNGDGKAEVVVGLGRGGQGWVYVGNLLGTNSFTFSSSLQVPSIVPNYNSNLGETRPAVGDLDGDGRPEIVVGLGQGGNGYLAVYGSTTSGYQLRQWLQIPSPGYNSANGETRPAVGDVDGDGKAEIVVGLGQQGSGLYAIFGHTPSGYVFKRWLSAGITGWPAVGDTDGDGRAEILCGNQYQWGIGVFRGTTLDNLAFERWISTQYGPIPAIGNLVP